MDVARTFFLELLFYFQIQNNNSFSLINKKAIVWNKHTLMKYKNKNRRKNKLNA